MQTKLNPYINFKDNARQAMEFYHSIFGGKLQMSTFKEYNASRSPDDDNKIMHGLLETNTGLTLMGADTPDGMTHAPGANFSISLSGDDQAELSGYFRKLAAGGQVMMPLEQAPWGDTFGMLTDKFGVPWMVNITALRQ